MNVNIDMTVGRPSLRRHLIFLVISLTYVISYFHRAAPAVIGPVIARELDLGPAQLGLVASTYFWAYALTALPSGLLSDTWGARKTIGFFVLVAAIGGILFANAESAMMLAVSRFVVGLGVGVVYVAAIRIFSDWYRPDELATYSGLLLAVGNVGALLSTGPLVFLMSEMGWRHSFDVVAALTALASLACYIIIRNRPTGREVTAGLGLPLEATSHVTGSTLPMLVGRVFGDRRIYLVGALLFSFYGTFMGIGSLWAGPFLQDVYGLSKQAAGNILMFFPLGMIIGCPISGYISDRVLHSRRKVLFGGGVLHLLSYLPLTLCNNALNTHSLCALFFWYGLSGSAFVVCFACIKEVYHKSLAGTAVGALNIFLFTGGAFYQNIIGALIGMQGGHSDVSMSSKYAHAFMAPVVGLVIGLIAFSFFKEDAKSVSSSLLPGCPNPASE